MQKVFVILAFSEHHVEWAVDFIGLDNGYCSNSTDVMGFHSYLLLPSKVPYIGPYIQSPFSEYLDKQKKKLHRKPGEALVHVSLMRCTLRKRTNLSTKGIDTLSLVPRPFFFFFRRAKEPGYEAKSLYTK